MTNEPVVLRLSRPFDVAPERVFDAWLDADVLRRWMYTISPDQVVRATADARVGGQFSIVERRDGRDVEVVGQYFEIDRPRRLVFDVGVPRLSPDWDRVAIDLSPTARGCLLTLAHENVQSAYVESVEQGWARMLASLELALR